MNSPHGVHEVIIKWNAVHKGLIVVQASPERSLWGTT